jgi:hypothetical protein
MNNYSQFDPLHKSNLFFRSHRPAHKSYVYRMERKGKLVRDCNLIVPNDLLERTWEEPH